MDCLLANQLGYNAITGTTGVGTFPAEWAKYFTGKRVIICFDIDEAGKAGADRVAKLLSKYVSMMKIIELPLDINKYPGGDFTDYIIKEGHTKQEFNKLLKQTKKYQIKDTKDDKYFDVSLVEADHAKYNNKYIKTTALVSGKGDQAYIIPKKIKATCPQNFGEKCCSVCPMSYEGGLMDIKIDITDRSILTLVETSEQDLKRELREIIGAPRRCNKIDIQHQDALNVEEVIMTTEVEYTTDIKRDEQFVVRQAFFVGHNIESNRSYTFEGKTVSHPKNQKGTHLMFKATPSLTAIENYKFTDQVAEKLQKFRTEHISDKIKDMYDTTITHVSGLIGREDLFTLALLTYCSPLSFKFQDKTVKKGYIESLVLGDTRTGKTEMMKSVIEYFKLGELVLGESASFAGLVGGLQQVGNTWHLTWGRIPLNNRRLVAIDEMSGLSTWEIAKLSGIRSSGIAEITKIRTERTWAKTRLIWMSNPRGSKEDNKRMMSSYSQGVRAVPELVGKQEDISRFDIILLLGIDDVEMDLINKPTKAPKTLKYMGDEFHDLVMFAWTLTEDKIHFTQDAMDKIYECTKYLSFTYDASIPLIMPSEQRIKLAKIALAAACISFNWNDYKLIVQDIHVQFAYEYLCQIFNKPITAYDEYSRLEKGRYQILNQQKVGDLFENKKFAIDQLLDVERMTQTDIQEIFNVDSRSDTRKILNVLLTNKALRRSSSGYEKTPAFIEFLREHKNGKMFKSELPDSDPPPEFDGEQFEETDDTPF
jgi:hypothetical protein